MLMKVAKKVNVNNSLNKETIRQRYDTQDIHCKYGVYKAIIKKAAWTDFKSTRTNENWVFCLLYDLLNKKYCTLLMRWLIIIKRSIVIVNSPCLFTLANYNKA